MIGRPVPAIVIHADRFDLLRCRCPTCIGLDARYPNEGWQLALFPYRPMSGPLRKSNR